MRELFQIRKTAWRYSLLIALLLLIPQGIKLWWGCSFSEPVFSFLEIFFLWLYISAILFLGTAQLAKAAFIFFTALLFLFEITDLFLLQNFSTLLNYDIITLVFCSNTTEFAGFAKFYLLNVHFFALLVFFPVLFISIHFSKKRLAAIICAVIAAVSLMDILLHFPQKDQIPHLSFFSRVDFLLAQTIKAQEIYDIEALNANIQAQSERKELLAVLVIGEAHSRRHSGIYGYPQNNMPLTAKRLKQKGFYRFNDVVAPHSLTSLVMPKLLTFEAHDSTKNYMNSHNIIDIFKKAGFNTVFGMIS